MVTIYKYAFCFVLKQKHSIIDIEVLGRVINLYLQNNIDPTLNLERCVSHDKYIIVAPYADLKGPTLLSIITETLDILNILYKYEGKTLPDHDYQNIAKILPHYSERRGAQHGGRVEDDRGIENGVKPLVDILNKFPGIKTFASCEGHQNSPRLYVCFRADTMENLNLVTRFIDSCLENTWKRYGGRLTGVNISLLFDYGHWEHQEGVYFEIHLDYPIGSQRIIFSIIVDLVEQMKVGLASVGRGASLEN